MQDKFLRMFSFIFKPKSYKLDHIFRHMTYFKAVRKDQGPMDKRLHNFLWRDQNIASLYKQAYKLLRLDPDMCP